MEDYGVPQGPLDENLPILADDGAPSQPATLASDWGLDIEKQVFLMEKAVEYGNRLVRARNTLVRMFTYEEDWKQFGDGANAKACLSAAGVLRIVDKANFPIKYHDIKNKKEDIKDEHGTVIGYRYVFEGYASMHNRTVYAIGQFSTRDKFLGYAGGEWRDPIEINESHIRQAAHTYFKGNAAKDLLGLKNIPWQEYEDLTRLAGQDPTKTTSVKHRSGTSGGISNEQRGVQDDLSLLLRDLAGQLRVCVYVEETDDKIISEPSEELIKYIEANAGKPGFDSVDVLAKASLRAMTTWTNKQGKVIAGKTDVRSISEKQAKMVKSQVTKMMKDEGLLND